MRSKQHNMIQPFGQYVLVKPFESENISEGGILIPDNAKKASNKVKIVEVGAGSPKNPMRLTPGDVGYRVKNHGQEILIDGEIHYLLQQSTIIALQ